MKVSIGRSSLPETPDRTAIDELVALGYRGKIVGSDWYRFLPRRIAVNCPRPWLAGR
jgi:hypothetical protein